jgi:2-C-methyl-D-erythritol 4-phosphate cytidylyltransferase
MMKDNLTVWGLIPAAGVGARMQASCPKQYLPLAGQTVLETTLLRLKQLKMEGLTFRWFVGLSEDDAFWPELAVAQDISVQTFIGGKERADTVLNGLRAIEKQASDDDWVLVHDAARPCFRGTDIYRLFLALNQVETGGILAVPVTDTLKLVGKSLQETGQDTEKWPVKNTPDRNGIWGAQTPQLFRYKALRHALEAALKKGYHVTDESSAIEFAGLTSFIVEGHADNIKITRPGDLELADYYLSKLDPEICMSQSSHRNTV